MLLVLCLLLGSPGTGAPVEPYRNVKVTIVRAEDPRPDYRTLENGLIAVRDSKTGELRAPTPEERAEIEAMMPVDLEGVISLPEKVADDGSISVVVGNLFLSYSVIRRSADGATHFGCTEDPTVLSTMPAKEEVVDDRK